VAIARLAAAQAALEEERESSGSKSAPAKNLRGNGSVKPSSTADRKTATKQQTRKQTMPKKASKKAAKKVAKKAAKKKK
jgi:pyruvate,orthophosphate dikinase